jgi:hypothetical protein
MTLAVTLVRVGPGYPTFEVGAYRYTGTRLPAVGETIRITRSQDGQNDGPRERLGYVTRVDPSSEVPIRVTEPTGPWAAPADDL